MKKICIAVVLAGVLYVPSLRAAFDGTIGVETSPLRSGTGGPFKITILSSASSALNKAISLGNPFISFCVEQSETINLLGNQGYQVNVNTAAVTGGNGGGNPDPISRATAWLYSQFRAGTLAANAGWVNNTAGNADLQQAIWYLENEQSTGNNYLVQAAALATGSANGAAARLVNANGAFNVGVLNVNTADGLLKLQDQLVLVPEPSTYLAGALLLIPVLVQIRRWKRSA